MSTIKKSLVIKLLPLIILYLLFIISFLGNSDYKSIIILTAVIPLAIYILTENSKLKRYLQYLLYFFIAGLVTYWVFGSYGLIWGMFNGYFPFPWQSCFFDGCYGENTWNMFIQSGLFQVDLMISLYLGIIYLAIKNKNRISS
jgi:hypothetical protein